MTNEELAKFLMAHRHEIIGLLDCHLGEKKGNTVKLARWLTEHEQELKEIQKQV